MASDARTSFGLLLQQLQTNSLLLSRRADTLFCQRPGLGLRNTLSLYSGIREVHFEQRKKTQVLKA